MLLTPPPVTNRHTFSDPLPLERDVLYERPLRQLSVIVIFRNSTFCFFHSTLQDMPETVKLSLHPPKFLMTFFKVVNSKFQNLTSNSKLFPCFFPKYVHFPLKTSPILSCTKLSFPLKCQKMSSPPLKLPKKLFPPKIAMMKISASFPHRMDAPD